MIQPNALQSGDTISIVSPASPIAEEKLGPGIALLESAGYKIKLGKHVLDTDGYLAGPDEHRAQDLMDAFLDPDTQAVLCSRGGYGASRLIPLLDLDAMAARQKLFVGFSDVTTLHLALQRRNLATLYAPMLLTFVKQRDPWVIESFLGALKRDHTIPEGAPQGKPVVAGVGKGMTTGGCLCLLCDSLATVDTLDAMGKVLFIEDVDENPHRVDAMFTHLLNAGILQSASAVVVGEMTGTDEKEDPTIGTKPWREIVSERLHRAGVPSMIDFPFGHAPNMLSLPLGVRAEVDASQGTLKFLEPLCD